MTLDLEPIKRFAGRLLQAQQANAKEVRMSRAEAEALSASITDVLAKMVAVQANHIGDGGPIIIDGGSA